MSDTLDLTPEGIAQLREQLADYSIEMHGEGMLNYVETLQVLDELAACRAREQAARLALGELLDAGQFVHGYSYVGEDGETHEQLFVTNPEMLDHAQKHNEILRFQFKPISRKEHERLAALRASREPKGER